jgi:hypothetical protein
MGEEYSVAQDRGKYSAPKIIVSAILSQMPGRFAFVWTQWTQS